MYRIVCETGSASRSTLTPRQYLDRDVKVEESSSKFVTENKKRSDMNKGQTMDYETTARLCDVNRSCLVQLYRSFIDSFIEGRTNLRVGYNEGQSVSVCSVYSATTSLFPSASSLQSLYILFGYEPCRVTPKRVELWHVIEGNVRKLQDKCSVGMHNEVIWIVKDGQRVQVSAWVDDHLECRSRAK